MSKRISHSILDPWIGPRLQQVYRILPIPRWFPPEGIVLIGHLFAVVGAIGFAYSLRSWWGGILLAVGVLGNHTSDCIDGTHARTTGQCRNGGELLDHFTDPLSFSYWLVGWSGSIERLDLGLAAVIILYATAVLTSIKAKMIGEFTLAAFGPTEFKSLLFIYGIVLAVGSMDQDLNMAVSLYFFVFMLAVGILQLLVGLVTSIKEVNRRGAAPDTSEWETTRAKT